MIFNSRERAEAAKNALNGIRFDPENPRILRVEFARANTKMDKSKLLATPIPSSTHPALGIQGITHGSRLCADELTGPALISTPPSAWTPYQLYYAAEMAPAISHPLVHCAPAALHTQVHWGPALDSAQQEWKFQLH